MKSKMKKKMIAFLLCMVLVICNSVSILADTPAAETTTTEKQAKETGAAKSEGVSEDEKSADNSKDMSKTSEETEETKEEAPETKTTKKKEETTEATTQKKEESTTATTTEKKEETEESSETSETKEVEETATTGSEEGTSESTEKTDSAQDKEAKSEGKTETNTVVPVALPDGASVPDGYTEEYTVRDSSGVAVTVYAPKGVVGEGASLHASLLDSGSEAYNAAEDALADSTQETDNYGFAAMDIHFEDVNGKEVEPNGKVYVVIDVGGILPEDVNQDTVTVQHHDEQSGSVDVETVADAGKETKGVVAVGGSDVQAAFDVGSFSTYTIYWQSKNGLRVQIIDTEGNPIGGDKSLGSTTISSSGSIFSIATDIKEKRSELSDYVFSRAVLATDVQRAIESTRSVARIRRNNSRWQYSTTNYNNDKDNYYSNINQNLYLIYDKDDTPENKIKVYVYVASRVTDENGNVLRNPDGSYQILSDECLELLGIDKDTIDQSGYFPAGEIYLDSSFLENKLADISGAALITKESEWSELLDSLSDMNTSTLIDQSTSTFSGLQGDYKLDYSKNKNNSLPKYYQQAIQDIEKGWGSQCTALFRWHDDASVYGNGHYGFADQSVKYHLDLRFKTNTIKFILGDNGINSNESPIAYDGLQIDSRAYITGSEIQEPRNLNIPDGYYFDGFYKDKNFKNPWDGIGTPLNEDQMVYIKLSKYPVLTMTKTFDGLSDAEVNYLIFGMSDGFGWDINYCKTTTHESTTGSNQGQTYMAEENDIPRGFMLPDGTAVTGGGDFRITAEQFLNAGDNGINNISGITGDTYTNEQTGATLHKQNGSWVFSISFEVPATDDNHFYTVFEQHQEVPGYAKINDSNAEWSITQNGETVDSGIGKFIDNSNNNIYESMDEITHGNIQYSDTSYNEEEDVCIAAGAFKKIAITESTTIAFTNHYKGDLDVTKEIGDGNQYNGASHKEYEITIQPAHSSKLNLGSAGAHGLEGKSFTYEIVTVGGNNVETVVEETTTRTLNTNGAFSFSIKPGQIVHFYDLPAIQWKVVEDTTKNAVGGYNLNITYADENNNVVNNKAHWNGYGDEDTIGADSSTDGVASVDSAVRDIQNVDAEAVAFVTVKNVYTPINGNLTITKEVVGAEVSSKNYSFIISTTNENVAGKTYKISNSSNKEVAFTEVENDTGYYTAEVSFDSTTNNSDVDGSITIEALPVGEYTVSESESVSDIEGYHLVSVGYKVGEENTDSISLISSGENRIDVINTYAKQWQLVKISSTPGEKIYLGGAEFTATTTKDEEKTYYGKSNETSGIIQWYEGKIDDTLTEPIGTMLPNGTYTITETKAPTGYQITDSGWTLKVENGYPTSVKEGETSLSLGNEGATDTFYLENDALYDLPSAGGPGIYWYTLSGTLLMAGAALIVYRQKRKREVLLRK